SALRHRRAPRDRGPGHPRLRGAGRRAAPDRPRRRARGAGARAERAPSRAQRSDPARREREGARMDRRLRMTRWASAAALALALVCCSPAAAAAPSRCGSHPWCNTSLSPDARAKLMLGAMSTSDKEGILTGQAESDVGLPAIRFTDGAVGAGGVGSGTKPATAMPAAIALAANF